MVINTETKKDLKEIYIAISDLKLIAEHERLIRFCDENKLNKICKYIDEIAEHIVSDIEKGK